jgi:hypothetical protein
MRVIRPTQYEHVDHPTGYRSRSRSHGDLYLLAGFGRIHPMANDPNDRSRVVAARIAFWFVVEAKRMANFFPQLHISFQERNPKNEKQSNRGSNGASFERQFQSPTIKKTSQLCPTDRDALGPRAIEVPSQPNI